MSELPVMDPGFVAVTIGALPSRLQRKLDGDPGDPASWEITRSEASDGTIIIATGTATITLKPPTHGRCDCLLSPKCLHLAQVLMACPVQGSADAASPDSTGHTPDNAGDASVANPGGVANPGAHLPEAALTALDLADHTLDALIDKGLGGLSHQERAAVLRVVSVARVHHLHRLAATFATLHGRLRDPAVTDAAIDALVNCVLASTRLRHGHRTGTLDVEDLGVARRRYEPVGTLRLHGWVCEPVITDGGYAGVVTSLVAEDTGTVWTLNSVLPGGAGLARQAYVTEAGLPETTIPHTQLVRSGLLLVNATGSADHRLGRGKGVRASLRAGTAPDGLEPRDGWWTGTARIVGPEAAPGFPLLRLDGPEGTLRCGFAAAAWLLGAETIRQIVAGRDTLVDIRLRARQPEERHRARWTLLGIRSDYWWDGRWIFPGLDRPARAQLGFGDDAMTLTHPTPAGIEPATVMRRWRDTVARQGRRGVIGGQVSALERDRRWLDTHASPHRAELLGRLTDAAAQGTRGFDGTFIPDPAALRPVWTALALAC